MMLIQASSIEAMCRRRVRLNHQGEDMQSRKIFCLVLVLCAFSEVRAASLKGDDCSNATTQAQIDACATQALKKADVQLNDSFNALLHKVSGAGRQKLQTAERSWIQYRDAQCAFNTMGSAGGSIHPASLAACEEGLTRMQTTVLNSQLHCQEGDASCGNQ
jgi:uncharacterized protein YecT (DUF1311 family)